LIKTRTISTAMLALILGLTVYYFFPENKLPPEVKIDKLIVYKSKRHLLAYSNGQLIKIYKVSLGRQPVGAKEFEGDNKTPEGTYFINDKNPKSICYKNLGISYPNKDNIKKAKQLGKSAGGNIKIHGLLNNFGFIDKFHRWTDLTYGCIMVTNQEMDELYHSVNIGTTIEIKP
jgi:murein L,D-transpeptidase YafK